MFSEVLDKTGPCGDHAAAETYFFPPPKSRLRTCGKMQLVQFIRGDFRSRLGRPRRNGLLFRGIQRFHRFPRGIDALGEQIADQEVGDDSFEVRKILDELPEAEAIVVFANEPPHAIYSLVEDRPP